MRGAPGSPLEHEKRSKLDPLHELERNGEGGVVLDPSRNGKRGEALAPSSGNTRGVCLAPF